MEIFTSMTMLKIPVSIPYKMKGILYLTCLDWYFTLTLHWVVFCVLKRIVTGIISLISLSVYLPLGYRKAIDFSLLALCHGTLMKCQSVL